MSHSLFVERETGLEPATTCLEDTEKTRRAPLAPFLDWIIGETVAEVNLMALGNPAISSKRG